MSLILISILLLFHVKFALNKLFLFLLFQIYLHLHDFPMSECDKADMMDSGNFLTY